MQKDDATRLLNQLNSVINGSDNIIKSIDSGKNINIPKALRASMINSKNLAKVLKEIIMDNTYSNNASESFANNPFGGIFK